MSVKTNRNPFGIDPNATSPNRIRRNFQRLATLALNGSGGTSFTASPPLNLSGGSLSLELAPNAGLYAAPSGLEVLLAANGGLQNTSSGLINSGFRTASSSPLANDGDTYYDTTLEVPRFQQDGLMLNMPGTLFNTTTDSNSINNTSTQVYNQSYTMPANFFTLGKAVRWYVAGHAQTPQNGGTPLWFLNVLLAGTNLQAQGLVFPNNPSNTEDLYWAIDIHMVCRNTGTSGHVYALGFATYYFFEAGTNYYLPVNFSATPYDTTVPQALQLSTSWNSYNASNSSVINYFLVQTEN